MPFLLHSNFKPTGDQPQAINKLIKGLQSGEKHQTLLGVTGSGKTFTIANVIEAIQKPTLVISPNKTLAAQLYQEFRDFFPNNAVSYFVSYYDYYQPEAYLPATDTYIEKETNINDEIDKLRLSATANLLTRPDNIVVASVSCLYNLGSPLEYGQYVLELISGQLINRQQIIIRLTDLQYSRNDFDLDRGNFSVKGDTITIRPAYNNQIIKLNFLEQQLESIIIDSQKVKRLSLYPAKHYLITPLTQKQAINAIKKDLKSQLQIFKAENKIVESYRLEQKITHDLDMIQSLGYVNGIENYSRYFDGRRPGEPPFSLMDYFKFSSQKFKTGGFLTIIDESHLTIPQIRSMYHGDRSRKQTLIQYGFRLPSALDNRPLKFLEFLHRLDQTIYVSATPNDWEISQSNGKVIEQLIRPTGLADPEIFIRPSINQIQDLIKEIRTRIKAGERTLVITLTKRTAEALAEFINAEKIKVQYLHSDIDTLDRSDTLTQLRQGNYDVLVGINLLREGLDLPEVSLVAILDADKAGFLRSSTSLIQTMGRASRHLNGKVIMYADQTTKAMEQAIREVKRRRQVQLAYNRQHHLQPSSIIKPIRQELIKRNQPKNIDPFLQNLNNLTPQDKLKLIPQLKKQMKLAARQMNFELAAQIRDQIWQIQS